MKSESKNELPPLKIWHKRAYGHSNVMTSHCYTPVGLYVLPSIGRDHTMRAHDFFHYHIEKPLYSIVWFNVATIISTLKIAYNSPAIPFISSRIIFVSRSKINWAFCVIDKNATSLHFLVQLIMFDNFCKIGHIEYLPWWIIHQPII